ncbi:MAG: AI-2E family transporter [Sphingobacteriales bacterium JAD_PAG50586_3]|nr:MAG: AI-2E family transporter [Sphingobacteriales bacterium JAD_PAG50586_3]
MPFYIKASQVLIGVVAFFFIMYIGSGIIIPLIFATIIAILLNPLVNWLHKRKIHRVIAIVISLLVAIILLGGLVYFIVWQTSRFGESLPQLKQKFNLLLAQSMTWGADTLNIEEARISGWIDKLKSQSGENSSQMVGQTLNTVGSLFMVVFIMPIYVFTILYYKPLLLQGIAKMFKKESHEMVADVLGQTKGLIQSYLIGLLIESAIVATLNSVGLLIIGVKYALLLGLLSALLNLIPYIGIIIATILPVVMALALQSPVAALWVFALFMVVQFIDNQYIVPYIVASKVKVNALVSIIVVLVGGALWGVAGMFLAIPLAAIAKVVFDRIPQLEPLGFLLGDDMPDEHKLIFNLPGQKKEVKKVAVKAATKVAAKK